MARKSYKRIGKEMLELERKFRHLECDPSEYFDAVDALPHVVKEVIYPVGKPRDAIDIVMKKLEEADAARKSKEQHNKAL